MKRLLFVTGVALALAAPSRANTSLAFSAAAGADHAWSLKKTGGNWTLTFPNQATVIDATIPGDPILVGDFVRLPTMTLSEITDGGTYLTAILTPDAPLTIRPDSGGSAVLTALMKPADVLIMGTTFAAYTQLRDDLDIISFNASYGTIIPSLAAQENAGLPLDISFTGDRKGDGDLRTLILSDTDTAEGTLSGQISVIPLPGALLLSSLGLALVHRLRATGRLPRRS
jgi:hypothetical protein